MANGARKTSMFLAALFTAFTCMSYMPADAATKTTKKTVVSAATVNYNAAVKAVVDYEKAIKGYKLTSKYNLDFCQAKYKVAMAALGKLNTKAASTKTLVNRVMAARKVWDAAYKNYLAAQNNNNNSKPDVVATVESIAPVADVTVNEGEKAVLPSEVTLNMSDKTTKTAKVTWGAVDTTKVGVVTVEGTVEGTDKKATVKVEVKAVVATVKEVVADTAKSFKVTFSKAVDTSKIKFEVKRGSVDVSVTPKWNDAKTEAVLDSSVKFVEGKYTVVVKNETSEMANKAFDITKERIAKIEIVGDMIVRTTNNAGYIAYKVVNQYGEDITSSALGRNIKFASVAQIEARQNGMLYVYYDINPADVSENNRNPMLQLRGLKEVAITAYDVESNVSATKTVKVSELLGSISEVTFKGIKNKDNKELEYGDRVNRFYIDYEIKDAAGNLVTDYTIISSGLQDNGIITSNPAVATARLIDDNGKAVFVVEPAMTPQSAHFDGTAIISVVTKSGKMATVNVTVKRPAMVDSVVLSQPTKEIAAGEKAEIPFVAYDQNGKEVKEYNRIRTAITLDSRLELVQNPDGTAKIVTKDGLAKGQHSFTVTTSTGKMSMVTVTVRDAVKVESLAVDSSVLVPFMVKGTSQSLDLGYLYGGIELKDQYGRKINLLTNNKFTDGNETWYYFVKARVSSGNSISVTKDTAVFGKDIELTATANEGTSIIEFKVYKSANSNLSNAVAVADLTRTVSLTVVKDEDVVDFTMDAISSDFYAAGTSKASEKEYGQWTTVYGKLANGGQVVIPDSWVKSITASSDKFTTSTTSAASGFYVYATTLPSTMTEASGKVVVSAQTASGRLVTTTTDIKSKSADRVISSIDLYVKTIESDGNPSGIVKDGDNVYVKLSAKDNVIGKMITRYAADGSTTNRGYVYFRVKDQYGKYGVLPAYISVIDQTPGLGARVENGVLTVTGTPAAGNFIMVQAVTSNGLSKVVKIVFEN